LRVKDSFPKVGIFTVIETDHQPRSSIWGESGDFFGSFDAFFGRKDHGSIGGHINTIGSSDSIGQSEVANRGQILVTSSTDELEPVPRN
jgi:hypothetical protein